MKIVYIKLPNNKPVILVRLMVSGSAALPEPIMTRWQEITG